MNLNFDPTIKLGDMITVVAFLVVGMGAFYNIKEKLKLGQYIMEGLGNEIAQIKKTMELNATTLSLVATQKVELEHLKQDINELKHGEGFVLPLSRKFKDVPGSG